MVRTPSFLISILVLSAIVSCSKQDTNEPEKKSARETLINVTKAQIAKLESHEDSVGTLEGLVDPTVAAEVAGRVLKVFAHPGQTVKKGELIAQLDDTDYTLQRKEAQSEIARLEVLLANQTRSVERHEKLLQKNFISQNSLDDASTLLASTKEELDGAKAKLASLAHTNSKAKIYAPVDGIVQKQVVATGDFVQIGDPILQIVGKQKLRAHLPYPEALASKIHPGLTIRLSTPTAPQTLTTTVQELKPMVNASSHAIDVIADVVNQEGWQPGASVNGSVILSASNAAIVIPEVSVVLRPAGEVVYVIKNNVAEQRLVKTGAREAGQVEIIEGLQEGEVIATDGAGFLTNKAKVKLQETSAKTEHLKS